MDEMKYVPSTLNNTRYHTNRDIGSVECLTVVSDQENSTFNNEPCMLSFNSLMQRELDTHTRPTLSNITPVKLTNPNRSNECNMSMNALNPLDASTHCNTVYMGSMTRYTVPSEVTCIFIMYWVNFLLQFVKYCFISSPIKHALYDIARKVQGFKHRTSGLANATNVTNVLVYCSYSESLDMLSFFPLLSSSHREVVAYLLFLFAIVPFIIHTVRQLYGLGYTEYRVPTLVRNSISKIDPDILSYIEAFSKESRGLDYPPILGFVDKIHYCISFIYKRIWTVCIAHSQIFYFNSYVYKVDENKYHAFKRPLKPNSLINIFNKKLLFVILLHTICVSIPIAMYDMDLYHLITVLNIKWVKSGIDHELSCQNFSLQAIQLNSTMNCIHYHPLLTRISNIYCFTHNRVDITFILLFLINAIVGLFPLWYLYINTSLM